MIAMMEKKIRSVTAEQGQGSSKPPVRRPDIAIGLTEALTPVLSTITTKTRYVEDVTDDEANYSSRSNEERLLNEIETTTNTKLL